MLKQIRTDEIGIDTCVDPSTYLYNNIIATVVRRYDDSNAPLWLV